MCDPRPVEKEESGTENDIAFRGEKHSVAGET